MIGLQFPQFNCENADDWLLGKGGGICANFTGMDLSIQTD